MSGLLDAINVSRTTLEAARVGIQVTGNNISNVTTEGFHRRRLMTSPIDTSPTYGSGVQVDGAPRAVDELLAKRVNTSVSGDSWASTRQALLLQVEQSVADLGEGGLGAAISNLMNKFSELAAAPSDISVRNEVLSAAQSLCDTFNQISANLNAVADGAEKEVVAAVGEINQRTSQVADLNAKIIQAEANGLEASDLRDQRDVLVSELSSLAGVNSFVDGSGQITVLLGSMTLVQGNHAAKLEAVPDTSLNGKSRIDLVDGTLRADITARIDSGKLGALLSVRDTTVPDILGQVDQLAYDMVSNPAVTNNLNAQHRAGFGLDGQDGRDLFTPLTGAAGAAGALQLRAGITAAELAASSTGLPGPITTGNGENALAMARMANDLLAGNGTTTYSGKAAAIVGQVGTESAQAQQTADIRKDELSYLKNLQQSSDGVSLDEEMAQLIQYQRLYQAGTRVLQIVDELLAGVIQL